MFRFIVLVISNDTCNLDCQPLHPLPLKVVPQVAYGKDPDTKLDETLQKLKKISNSISMAQIRLFVL